MKQCMTKGCDGSSGFGSNRAAKDGLSRLCKECTNKRAREYRAKHPEVERNAQRMQREKRRKLNLDGVREQNRLYMRKRRAEQRRQGNTKSLEQLQKQRDYALRWKYGITLAQFEQMHHEQNAKCKICNRDDRELYVDHCHASGIVRGLLCTQCNTAAGLISDSPETAQSMADYLRNAQAVIDAKAKEAAEFATAEFN